MRASVAAAGLLLLLALAACSRGPDADVLRADVSARLAEALPDGGLELAGFERRGSQTDTHAPAGEQRCILYFDADLKLTRDYKFGTWDGPGVAVLVSTLGAGPKGITGISSDGNRAGDVLHVHGTVVYRREGDAWVALAAGGHEPAVAPSLATGQPENRAEQLLEEMRKVVNSIQRDASGVERKVVDEELAAANAAIRARLAHVQEGIAIAAGPENGQYLRYVRAAAEGARQRIVPLITRGGDENLRLLRSGKVLMALAQADAALAAYEGTGNFVEDGPFRQLRAVGSLYPEALHVLVRADAPFTAVAELKGKRIAIGLPGSASRTTALLALAASGLQAGDYEALELGPDEALVAVQKDRADAALQVIGVPADAVRNAVSDIPLRLLPLAPDAVASLVASNAGDFAFTISRGSYPRQREDVPTIATAALLLASSGLSDPEVDLATRFVYGRGRDLAALGSVQGALVSAANARNGVTVPMHPAALLAIDELK